jgi:hypothetical protein
VWSDGATAFLVDSHSSHHFAMAQGEQMRGIIIGSIAGLWLASPAQSAEITVSQRLIDGTLIHIDGPINMGDDAKLAAIKTSDPANTVVQRNGAGAMFLLR